MPFVSRSTVLRIPTNTLCCNVEAVYNRLVYTILLLNDTTIYVNTLLNSFRKNGQFHPATTPRHLTS